MPVKTDPAIAAIVEARHGDPFGFLGMHKGARGNIVVRAFIPWASKLELLDGGSGETVAELLRVHEGGFYAVTLHGRKDHFPYRFRAETQHGPVEFEDVYRFPQVLGELDIHLLAEGNHLHAYER